MMSVGFGQKGTALRVRKSLGYRDRLVVERWQLAQGQALTHDVLRKEESKLVGTLSAIRWLVERKVGTL